ncbi:MAG: imidazolonepropionase, partial [Candidatus Marinimicrobia bacterium]|nr:imidazolonepropionase [Candidatus Neomarinimicrobiota bacterium]
MNKSVVNLINIGNLVTYNNKLQTIDIIKDTQILIIDDRIDTIGKNISGDYPIFDCKGKLITPGFVDPHTHPVFLTGREEEFGLRLQGATYQEIAEKGGGIISSILGVRNSTVEELVDVVTKRMDRFLKLGTTTIEAKSGYGLDVESELKSLKVLDIVNKNHPIDIISTFLGAHAFPSEFANDHGGYVDLIC